MFISGFLVSRFDEKLIDMENGKKLENYAFAMLDTNSSYSQYGLTKREYFAGLAMQSISEKLTNLDATYDIEITKNYIKSVSEISVMMADALLKQLEK